MTAEEARENLKKVMEALRASAKHDHLKRIEDAGEALMNAIRKNIARHYYNFEEDGDAFITALKTDRGYAYEVLTDGVLDKFIKFVEVSCEE